MGPSTRLDPVEVTQRFPNRGKSIEYPGGARPRGSGNGHRTGMVPVQRRPLDTPAIKGIIEKGTGIQGESFPANPPDEPLTIARTRSSSTGATDRPPTDRQPRRPHRSCREEQVDPRGEIEGVFRGVVQQIRGGQGGLTAIGPAMRHHIHSNGSPSIPITPDTQEMISSKLGLGIELRIAAHQNVAGETACERIFAVPADQQIRGGSRRTASRCHRCPSAAPAAAPLERVVAGTADPPASESDTRIDRNRVVAAITQHEHAAGRAEGSGLLTPLTIALTCPQPLPGTI